MFKEKEFVKSDDQFGGSRSEYQIFKVLAGGMGFVYIAHDLVNDEFVALKTLQRKYISTIRQTERFIHEAQFWIRLGYHPNIVTAREVAQIQGIPYIVLDYVEGVNSVGSSLRDWILKGHLTIQHSLDFGLQISLGLQFLEEQQRDFVHRDLKPENILITANEIAQITDFGLSTIAEEQKDKLRADAIQEQFNSTLTRTGNLVGTPPYMSPEQCLALRDIDSRSDIYALGLIMYEMLTGRWVFDVRTSQEWIEWQISGLPSKPSKLNPSITPLLDNIILKCLEKKPAKRFQSHTELHSALNEVYRTTTGLDHAPVSGANRRKTKGSTALTKARSLIAIDDDLSALLIIDELLKGDSQVDEANSLKALIMLRGNKADDALFYLRKVSQSYSNYHQVQNNIATAHLMKGQLREGMSILTSVTLNEPSMPEAWVNLGICYIQLKDFNTALKLFDKALSITPWNHKAWYNRGLALQRQGNRSAAIENYKQSFFHTLSYPERVKLAFQLVGQIQLTALDDRFFDLALQSIEFLLPQSDIYRQMLSHFGIEKLGLFPDHLESSTDDVLFEYVKWVGWISIKSNQIRHQRIFDGEVDARRNVESTISHIETEYSPSINDQDDPVFRNVEIANLVRWLGVALAGGNEYKLAILVADYNIRKYGDTFVDWLILAIGYHDLKEQSKCNHAVERCLQLYNDSSPILGVSRKEIIDLRI